MADKEVGMKRNFSVGVIALASLVALAGCSTGGGGSSSGTDKKPADVSGTIRVLDPEFPATNVGTAAFQKVVAIFNRTYPKVKVERDVATFATLNQKITTSIASGQKYDVVISGNGWIPPLASLGVLQDMTKLGVSKDSVAKAIGSTNPLISSALYQGDVYGMPLVNQPRILAYSKSAFAKAGLDPNKAPSSLAEVRADAKKLTIRDSSGKVTQEGFDFWTSAGNYRQAFVAVLGAMGQPLYVNGKPNYNTPTGVAALNWMTNVISVDKSSVYGYLNGAQSPSVTTGEAAMGFTSPYVDCSSSGIGQKKCDDIAYFNLTDKKPAVFSGGAIAGVGAGSKLVGADLAFIKALREDSSLKAMSELSVGIPASTSPAATAFNEQNPASEFASKNIQYAVAEGGSTNWLTVRSIFGPDLDKAILQKASPKSVLSTIANTK